MTNIQKAADFLLTLLDAEPEQGCRCPCHDRLGVEPCRMCVEIEANADEWQRLCAVKEREIADLKEEIAALRDNNRQVKALFDARVAAVADAEPEQDIEKK